MSEWEWVRVSESEFKFGILYKNSLETQFYVFLKQTKMTLICLKGPKYILKRSENVQNDVKSIYKKSKNISP